MFGFQRFWNEAQAAAMMCWTRPKAAIRRCDPTNSCGSVTLQSLNHEQQRAVVDRCADKLLTSHGLRSLAPDDPAYIGISVDRRSNATAHSSRNGLGLADRAVCQRTCAGLSQSDASAFRIYCHCFNIWTHTESAASARFLMAMRRSPRMAASRKHGASRKCCEFGGQLRIIRHYKG